jgi:undecaprenyl-diphosphatase
MILATRGGDGWLWYGLSALVIVFGGSTRYEAITAAWTACGAGAILFLILKKLTGRKRPNALEPHCWATLLPPDQFSFPSGHTITAFAFTVAVGGFCPHLLGVLLFCALSVATSRIVLGMHFLSDVVVGAILGAGLGYAGFMIFA